MMVSCLFLSIGPSIPPEIGFGACVNQGHHGGQCFTVTEVTGPPEHSASWQEAGPGSLVANLFLGIGQAELKLTGKK